MKLGIIITQTDPETVFNALRLAQFSIDKGDMVTIFLSGQGVEIGMIRDDKFDVRELIGSILESGGKFMACGSCLKLRGSNGSETCPLLTLADYYEVVRGSDRLVTV